MKMGMRYIWYNLFEVNTIVAMFGSLFSSTTIWMLGWMWTDRYSHMHYHQTYKTYMIAYGVVGTTLQTCAITLTVATATSTIRYRQVKLALLLNYALAELSGATLGAIMAANTICQKIIGTEGCFIGAVVVTCKILSSLFLVLLVISIIARVGYVAGLYRQSELLADE